MQYCILSLRRTMRAWWKKTAMAVLWQLAERTFTALCADLVDLSINGWSHAARPRLWGALRSILRFDQIKRESISAARRCCISRRRADAVRATVRAALATSLPIRCHAEAHQSETCHKMETNGVVSKLKTGSAIADRQRSSDTEWRCGGVLFCSSNLLFVRGLQGGKNRTVHVCQGFLHIKKTENLEKKIRKINNNN